MSQILDTLEAAIEAGRQAWPALSVPPEAFVAQIMGRPCSDEETREALSNLRPADAYLAAACAQGIPAALGAFEAAYFEEIPRLVSAAAADPALRGELHHVLRVGQTELESILRLLPSQLPLSLSRRLKAGEV